MTDNTLKDFPCNVQFRTSTAIINANGLDAKSEIGVYVPDEKSWYNNYGVESKPFGTRSSQLVNDNFYCFVNDRLPYLRGYRSAELTDVKIYWEYHPLLMVTKTVVSDWPEDQEKDFTFTVQLTLDDVSLPAAHNYFGDMDFNRSGTATVTVKAGDVRWQLGGQRSGTYSEACAWCARVVEQSLDLGILRVDT